MVCRQSAIPSGLNAAGKSAHDYHPLEQDANRRALTYFNKHIDGYDGWKFWANPIVGYNESLPFSDKSNQLALNYARLRPAWYDWVLGPNIIGNGLINWLTLKNKDAYSDKLYRMHIH